MARYYGFWAPYVPVRERKKQAAREVQRLKKAGHRVSPVEISGRAIARTFWGKAWCKNLECYSDFANRLPRGRTYARNGSVIDLQLTPGAINALVSGSDVYRVTVTVDPVPTDRFRALCDHCAGAIDSVVELLQGRLSKAVMERLCDEDEGLFPDPTELSFACSCPDIATMCKHVAAVLYGVGARLDHRPELLFKLRDVDEQQLIAKASADALLGEPEQPALDDDLASLFGIELDDAAAAGAAPPPPQPPEPEPPGEDDIITAADLVSEGVPRSTIRDWRRAGHLLSTATRGVYRVTASGWDRIHTYFAAKAGT